MHFFTRYGTIGIVTIWISTLLFIGFGTRVMLLAHDIGATSYEDLNRHLFGPRFGSWFSLLLLVELLSVSFVMLAGAGSVFQEHFGQPFWLGIAATALLAYWVTSRGMQGIMDVNTVVVPTLMLFGAVVFYHTVKSPDFLALNWLHQDDPHAPGRAWIAPLLYAAFNLASAQAVLVPLGSSVKDRTAILRGGIAGGAGLGLLLAVGHLSLSVHAPEVYSYEIPMGHVVASVGVTIHFLYLLVVYSEIFTTFVADVFGLSLQVEQRTRIRRKTIVACVLALCCCVSFIGFKALLTTLYPFFGALSLIWFVFVIVRHRRA